MTGGGGGGGGGSEANKALFLEKVRQSNSACQAGDFDTAISLYSEAIAMDKNNHILYSNRWESSYITVRLSSLANIYQNCYRTLSKNLNRDFLFHFAHRSRMEFKWKCDDHPWTLVDYKTEHFRSAAYIKMGQFSKAYQDAVKAKELNAEWPKVRSSQFMAAILSSIWCLLYVWRDHVLALDRKVSI